MTSSRGTLRRSVRPFRSSADFRAAVICVLDVSLFVAAMVAVVVAPQLAVKLLAAAVAGLVIARLFVIGHDACHQAFFSNRQANRVIGKLVFLPSLTPFSLWEAGHNVSHHVYTNLKTHDFVWTPLSIEEFKALPAWRQQLERFYRSGYGFWAYYGVEIWWRKMMFPNEREVPLRRPAFFSDSLLVCGFALFWLACLGGAAIATGQSVLLLMFSGFVLPLLVWQLLMGAVIYFQHTHPTIAWFDNTEEWETTREGLSGTMLVSFPKRLGWIINNIMEHPAHHLDVRIPLYQLEAAQDKLNSQQTGAPSRPFGWSLISDCVRCCKLYDYSEHRWTDFDGNYTSERLYPTIVS